MASNKNQHFVPRCYLKAFSCEGAGLAIDLFNLDRRKAIPKAPVKGQCSRAYFYGEDGVIEKWLQGIEGDYATALKAIRTVGYRLTEEHRDLLLGFFLVQYLRTEAASKRAVEMAAEIEEGAFDPLTIRDAVQMSMRNLVAVWESVRDLKACLVRNRTKVSFVTSDDPAVLTNRWHIQQHPEPLLGAGLASAGAILILPLTPEVLFLAYDGDVYAIDQKAGWAEVTRADDAAAFNQHQYLNCMANIYFADWADRDAVRGAHEVVADRRLKASHEIKYAVLDHVEGGTQVYREISHAESKAHERVLLHSKHLTAKPSSWPRLVRWRIGGVIFSDGGGGGRIGSGSM